MKRFPGFRTTLFAAGLAVAAAATAADQNAPGGPHGGMMAWGHHQMEKCLSSLDLSDAQKAAIDEARAAGKATLRADGEAMKAAHQKMQADLAAGADKSVLGQNAIDQDAANTKMKADAKALHEQILGQLTNDQLDQYNACASAARERHARPAPPATQ
jgi:Spy/CpxP family protein refolding chaperone